MKKFFFLSLLFILCMSTVQAQFVTPPKKGYDLIVMFGENVKQETIIQVRKQMNAVEIAITPVTGARLWRENTGDPSMSYSYAAAADTADRVRSGGTGSTTSVGKDIWIQVNKPIEGLHNQNKFNITVTIKNKKRRWR